MIHDPAAIAAMFEGTVLAGHSVREDTGRCLVVENVDPADVLPAWQAARAVLETTERWPVCLTPDWYQPHPDPGEDALADLDRQAREVDPWFGVFAREEDLPLSNEELQYWIPEFDGVDLLAEARQQLTSTAIDSVQRWLYERILADPGLLAQARQHHQVEFSIGIGQWYLPSKVELWLLPTPLSHLVPAWVPLFDTAPDQLSAVLWEWRERWGAEVVAHWGTMLQLVVDRRPAIGEQAWELARQHKEVATHQDTEHWALALALTRSDAWFLHKRP